jgi:hypothetical protein
VCALLHGMPVVSRQFASIPSLLELLASLDLVANRARVPTHAVRAASPAACRTVSGWVSAG